ncbi:hypothetical protein JCM8547_003771 [Rhodosporidiobolus lusitaniae]
MPPQPRPNLDDLTDRLVRSSLSASGEEGEQQPLYVPRGHSRYGDVVRAARGYREEGTGRVVREDWTHYKTPSSNRRELSASELDDLEEEARLRREERAKEQLAHEDANE